MFPANLCEFPLKQDRNILTVGYSKEVMLAPVSHLKFLVLHVEVLAHHLIASVSTFLQWLWSFLAIVSQQIPVCDLAWEAALISSVISIWLRWHENITQQPSTPIPTQSGGWVPSPAFICTIIGLLRLCEQSHLVATARTISSGVDVVFDTRSKLWRCKVFNWLTYLISPKGQ